KTLVIHSSFTKMLTVDVAVSAFLALLVLALTCVQMIGNIHSSDIEGLAYDVAVLPALIHPVLTLYFVPSYRSFVRACFALRKPPLSIAHRIGIHVPKMPN
ncbi:hypothetical protein PMAYCL1PPCAC_16335, partial [Pristionchus mayeri]